MCFKVTTNIYSKLRFDYQYCVCICVVMMMYIYIHIYRRQRSYKAYTHRDIIVNIITLQRPKAHCKHTDNDSVDSLSFFSFLINFVFFFFTFLSSFHFSNAKSRECAQLFWVCQLWVFAILGGGLRVRISELNLHFLIRLLLFFKLLYVKAKVP